MDKKILNNNLRVLRHSDRQLPTLKDYASQIGVDTTTLGRWERGETFPTINMLPMIFIVYGTSDLGALWPDLFGN